jgi:steroid delta-isomerase-like uncharacterized protein
MSAENKLLVRRWFDEVWNEGRTDAIDDMFAADGVAHGLGPDLRGPEEFKPFYAAYRSAFPDIRFEIEGMVAEGDEVAYRWTATATHRGPGLGFSATDRPVSFSGIGILRVRDGKLVEGWNAFDRFGMLQQLGVVQMPE